MKSNTSRHITVKALFSPDEFLEFEKACQADDVKQSPQIRSLVRDWLNRRRDQRGREWPAAGQFRPRFPGRRGAVHMPLRV